MDNGQQNQGIWATLKDTVVAINAIAQTMPDVVESINNLNTSIESSFPQADSSVSSTANAGIETLPSNPTGFLLIEVNGIPYKIALYEP